MSFTRLRLLARSIQHRNVRALARFVLTLSGLVTGYSIVFQLLMSYEGQHHSWVTGFYWTLSTMSTLGYGDISFVTDLGRIFSIVVLLSGIIFMLVLLPFTFIELFYEPWMRRRASNLIPRSVPATMTGHVILTFYGAVASALIAKLVHFKYPYVVILPEPEEVTRLNDLGIHAIFGELNDPEAYLNARVEQAAMVATTRSDIVNTSVVFTARGIAPTTPMFATARETASIEILRLAGCTRVLDLTHLMAEALARRALGGDQFTHVIGKIDDLLIAEVVAGRTSLVGQPYTQAQRQTSVSIIGFWVRGSFEVGQQDSVIESNTVLLLCGSRKQLDEFDAHFKSADHSSSTHPVVIIGGGRVGRSTAAALKRRGISYRIVESLPERILNESEFVLGDGADQGTLHKAGFDVASTVIITTHDDETNTYLAISCRLIRSDIQIICRSTLDRNVAALHRAGADIVMSYASMGSNALFNLLKRSDLLMIAEGLDVFKVSVPHELAGKTLADADLRRRTNCSVIGIDSEHITKTNPGPDTVLPAKGEIVLIGTPESENEFLNMFPAA